MSIADGSPALWGWLLQLGLIAGAILLSNFVLRTVPGLKKSLLPTAVLGGFLLLGLRYTGLVDINRQLLEVLAYHGIAIGFAAMGLQAKAPKSKQKGTGVTLAKTGALIVGGYLLQGILGLGTSLLLHFTSMPDLFPAAGLLLPMGYGQGPGQAGNVGGTFESLGFPGGRSFGLSIAAAGYLSACVVGVNYLNVIHRQRRKRLSVELSLGSMDGIQDPQEDAERRLEEFRAPGELPESAAVDRLSLQAGLVLVTYLLVYFVCKGASAAVGLMNDSNLAETVSAMIWGFQFLIATGCAMVITTVLGALKKRKIIKHQIQNNYLLGRLSGFAFDVMIVAAIASIDISQLRGYLLPFVIMSTLGAFFTLFYLQWLCPKLYPGYQHEGILSMYGMLTGTISSGVLLLREIDPKLKSPAVSNLLLGGAVAVLFGAPMLAFVGIAPTSIKAALVTLGLMAVYLTGLTVFMLKAKRSK